MGEEMERIEDKAKTRRSLVREGFTHKNWNEEFVSLEDHNKAIDNWTDAYNKLNESYQKEIQPLKGRLKRIRQIVEDCPVQPSYCGLLYELRLWLDRLRKELE